MAADKNTVERFRAAITAAFAPKTERIDPQIDFDDKYQHLFKKEYDTAIGLVMSVKTCDTLAALMAVYLELYARYSANANNVHFYRSDETFRWLFCQSGKVPAAPRDLFAEWTMSLSGTAKSVEFGTLRKRFDELDKTARSEIATFIKEERQRRRKTTSILDVLRSQYLARWGWPAKSDEDLYGFDPYPGDGFRNLFDGQFKLVATAWEAAAKDEEPLHHAIFMGAFDGFGNYLAEMSNRGSAQIFQVVKLLQERLRSKPEPVAGGTRIVNGDLREFVVELYVAACMRLLIVANRDLGLVNNRTGFTEEELVYFLRPLQTGTKRWYHAASDVAYRMAAKPDQWKAVFAWSKAFLSMVLLTRHHPFELVSIKTTLDIQSRWVQVFELTERLSKGDARQLVTALADSGTLKTLQTLLEMAQTTVDLTKGGPVLSQGVIRIGSTFRDVLGGATVVYIEPGNPDMIYVEFKSLKPFLFRIRARTAKDWLYGERLMDTYRSTVGAIYLYQAVLLGIGFLPALIEGGFAALIYEVGVYLGSVAVEEVASEVNPTAAKVLGFLTQIFTPRKRFGPKVVDPNATPPAVRLLDVNPPASTRSIDEILAAKEEEARLTADFHKSTVKGMAAHTWNSVKDAAIELEISLAEAAGKLEAVPVGQELATPTGHTFSIAGAPSSQSGGAGGTRGTGSAAPAPPAVTRLRRSKEYALLDDYLPKLTDDNARRFRKERVKIETELGNGTIRYKAARQRIVNLLNASKETTGEYVADGAVWSNYKVRNVVDIPWRTEKVPILDRVYEVENDAGEVFYVFAEIKGGEDTALGSAAKQEVVHDVGGVTIETLAGRVRQASPEWYHLKIIEIYRSGSTAQAMRRNQALARRLFDAAKAGKVESLVIKSGSAMNPFVRVDPNFTKWFQDKMFPFDPPRPPRR